MRRDEKLSGLKCMIFHIVIRPYYGYRGNEFQWLSWQRVTVVIILCSSNFVVVLYLKQLFAYVCMYMGHCPAKSPFWVVFQVFNFIYFLWTAKSLYKKIIMHLLLNYPIGHTFEFEPFFSFACPEKY